MEALVIFGVLIFVAGMATRSLFTTEPPPKYVIVPQEPQKDQNWGCLLPILIGALLLALLVASGG